MQNEKSRPDASPGHTAADESISEVALDNPIWTSLIGGHSHFALGQDLGTGAARRYPPAMGPFAGLREQTAEAFADLAQLIPVGETAALLFDNDPVVPSNWQVLRTLSLVQMVHRQKTMELSTGEEILRLMPSDEPEMISLAKMTEPGPFLRDTARLGEFYGIRIDAQLVAMAGQRFAPPGFVEVSAVCTHPNYRGRGLAGQLVAKVVQVIQAAGSVPFLTCLRENTGAIRLYETLGFSYRRSFTLGVLRPQGLL
jgi:predicted GNAT family acetyltransferase